MKFEDEVSLPSFSPDPDNDKIIIVCGWREVELQEILEGFIELYSSGWPSYRVDVSRKDDDCFRLSFPEDIHPSLLAFLVNYAMYPIDAGTPANRIRVVGQATMDDSFEGIPPDLFGRKAVLYNPEDGDIFDVVYLQTETGVTFANSLGRDNNWRRMDHVKGDISGLLDHLKGN
ncbi:MAG TPA: hypothetical protein VJU86_19865 [Pyrinomonadaceae bacterium]|nr:hypothetical protein [Pyrinomonadaceae bacterium]